MQKNTEWRVIRELQDDAGVYVVSVSKRRREEYSIRLSRRIERGSSEVLMPNIHIHVKQGVVPEFHDVLADLMDDVYAFICQDVAREAGTAVRCSNGNEGEILA